MNRKRRLGRGTTVPRGGVLKFGMEGTCGWKELDGDRNLVQKGDAGLGCKEELNPRQSPIR
jgi:hypothetical protein